MKTLNIASQDFAMKAVISGFDSATLQRSWAGVGVLHLTLNADIPNADKIAENDLLWFGQDYHKAHIIEKIQEELQNGTIVYKITAPNVGVMLRDLTTVPGVGESHDELTGTREQVARAWVQNNVGRTPYPIELGTYQGYGESITERTRYKNLAEEIERVLGPEDLGWGLTLDVSGQRFLFEVYKGTDRTQTAPITDKVAVLRETVPADFSSGTLTEVVVGAEGLELDTVDPTWSEVGTSKTWEDINNEFN